MKTPFTQNSKSGCGSYCLANLFNDFRYIEGVKEMTQGEGVPDLNRKLRKFDEDFYLDVLFQTCHGFTLQTNRLIDPIPFFLKWELITEEMKRDFVRPLILTVKNPVRFHSILVLHELSTDRFHIVDSLCQDIIVATLEDLMVDYCIISVELVCSWVIDAEDRSVFFQKSRLKHLINEA